MDIVSSTPNASSICRGCGGKNATKPLSVYGHVFQWCTSIDVSSSDGLPFKICDRCWEMLTISYEFKVLCTRTDRNMRARNSSEIEIENFPVLENGATEEYEQIETADDVQSEEVMEETILAGKERFDYVYKRIPEVEECITTEIEEIIENEVPESEILSNVSYLLQEDDKMNQNPLTKGDKCNQVFDQEAREENEEYVLDETVEYLEESCKEMSPPHKMPPEGHNETVSIVVLESAPKATNLQFVRHSCPDCGKHFSSRTNVVRHQHSHRGSKPYQCDICKKEFTQSGTLKTHRYCHFDIKPFVCNVCGKRFTQSKSVKLHLRCHTGEKPYSCDICNAAFRQKNGLQRHMKVHGERI